MAYCFHIGEAVRDGFLRIGSDQLESLLFDLRTELDTRRTHDARKRCKMLRALLRLARSGLDKQTFRSGLRRCREIAHKLSRARDPEVRLATFQSLVSRPNSCRDLAAKLEADAELANLTAFSPSTLKRLIAHATAARKAWNDAHFAPGGWSLIEPELRRRYRRARDLFGAIRVGSPTEAFHEWRKNVKTLSYHIRLLSKARPKKLKPLGAALDELGELLGADHDLAVLRAYAIEHEVACLDVLEPLIAHRRCKLQQRARAIAAPMFQERPRDFTAQLHRWWKEWRA